MTLLVFAWEGAILRTLLLTFVDQRLASTFIQFLRFPFWPFWFQETNQKDLNHQGTRKIYRINDQVILAWFHWKELKWETLSLGLLIFSKIFFFNNRAKAPINPFSMKYHRCQYCSHSRSKLYHFSLVFFNHHIHYISRIFLAWIFAQAKQSFF